VNRMELCTRVLALLSEKPLASEVDRAVSLTWQRLFRSETVLNSHQEDCLVREAARYLKGLEADRQDLSVQGNGACV
jgi:hypothetical protein